MSRAIQDIYPLTPTQRGMLFHSLHAAAPGVYVVQVAYTLRGELDEQAFAAAWRTLVQRHDVLRAAFVWDKVEAPVQVVGTQARLPLAFLDWQTLTPAERTAQLADHMETDRRRGFELSTAPLMRVSCIRLAPAERRVIWTYHHLLLDGWSLPILMREWAVAYRAARQGVSAVLPPALPYRDYPAWLARCDQAAARAFWRDSLAGVEPAPPLGNDTSGAGPVEATAQSVRRLAPALTAELTALARRERLTLSTIVQGAWALALARHAGDAQEIVYGLARAGRPVSLPHFDARVGLFLNLLPMRVSTASERTALDFLHALQAQQLAQQDYEFAALVDVHAQSGLPPTVPLFESVVVFENYPVQSAASLGDGELALADVSVGEQTNYPLNLFAAAIDIPGEAPAETLELRILHAAARFSDAAIARLHAQLEGLLTALAATPTARLGELPWLPAAERARVCRDWNRTRAPLPTTPVHAQIAARAEAQPTSCALSAGAQTLDYASLRGASAQLARHLLAAGVQPGQTIGVCLRRSPDLVIALLAVLEAGCAYVPLDPGYPAQRLRHVIEDAGLSRILVHDATAAAMSEYAALALNLDGAREAVARESVAAPDIAVAPTDLAYLIYTSGSTGEPKGVAVSHGSLSNLLAAMTTRLALPAPPSLLAVTTVAFDIAALELFLPLCAGGRLVLADEDTARDGQRLAALLEAEHIDLMQATPSTWRLLLDAGWQGRAGLHLLCGGEALDAELAHRLLDCGAALWNVYGPTETTIWSSALALTPALLADGKVPIGAPLANTSFYVLDAAQRPVPLGAAGELYIGGAGLARGYHGRPALTRERFVDNPFIDESGDDDALPASPRLYRTGDRVRYREDGTLDYLGRFDQQVKLHGHRIELEEIERALTTHPAIEQAIVVVQAPGTAAARLAAFVKRSNEATLADASLASVLREHLAPLLPAYMVPGVYHAPAAFPLTHNGKIDRLALQRLQLRKARQGEVPQTGLERAVVDVWQAVLGVEAIGVDDNFFELGGQSLLLINVQNRLRQELAMELPLVDLFRYPTPGSLAAHLAALSGDAPAAPTSVAQDRSAAREQGRQRQQQRLALRHPQAKA